MSHIARHKWWLFPAGVGNCHLFGGIIPLLMVGEILFFYHCSINLYTNYCRYMLHYRKYTWTQCHNNDRCELKSTVPSSISKELRSLEPWTLYGESWQTFPHSQNPIGSRNKRRKHHRCIHRMWQNNLSVIHIIKQTCKRHDTFSLCVATPFSLSCTYTRTHTHKHTYTHK